MLHFLDFETFKNLWTCVIINPFEKTTTTIVNDAQKLKDYYEKYKNEIFVGFNIREYDQYIFKAILLDFEPKEVNDFIIVKKRRGWEYSSLFNRVPLNFYDCMPNPPVSLKTLEGFMGNSIEETTISFNYDGKFTPSMIAEVLKYNTHDVEQTIEVFLQSKAEFDTMMYFIKHFKYPLSYICKTKAQLASTIIGANGKGKTFDDEFKFPILDCIQLEKYKHIEEWYRNPENHKYRVNARDPKSEKHKLVSIVAGVENVSSWGGGHAARPKYHAKGIFLLIDVTAYYPSQQYAYKFGYRVMDKPENFEFIHNSNIKFKRMGDKKARQPFKILANAISGQMKQKASKLYDPMSNNSICVNGQLLLLDLIEHLEPYCDLVQNNTDGIIVKLRSYNDFEIIDDVVYEWEKRTGMQMDIDQFFGEIFQKDVNNYLIVDKETGVYKGKGAYLKSLNNLDYDLPIVNEAMKEYMLHDVPVEKTVNDCDEFKKFQKIVKVSSKYDCGMKGYDPKWQGTKTKYLIDTRHERLNDTTFRVFASTRNRDGAIYKYKSEKGKPEKFANTPEKCFIENGNINGMKIPEHLDREWYINLAKERLRQYGVL